MCGIIGILSQGEVTPSLLTGLKRLEYRGYDSAGIAAVQQNGHLDRRRAEGKLIALDERLQAEPLQGRTGIGHTRWATHGLPIERNAHPHISTDVAVVHNGIIENYQPLKDMLAAEGFTFTTDTDTEVIVHLIQHGLNAGRSAQDASFAAFDQLTGAYAIVAIFSGEDDLLIGTRCGTPLAVGYGEGEMYVASDSYALAPLTQKICFLEDGDRIVVTRDRVDILDTNGKSLDRPIRITAQSGATTGKGEYPHFMLKEIYEQPSVIGDTLNSFVNPATGHISLPKPILEALTSAPRITLIACGTAFYAAMVGKYWLERIARIPCEVDIASEFRYREAPLPKGGVSIFISQSGETLDTLEALRYCKRQGQTILSIVNAIESTIERESDLVLHTLAGPEIGVASTKAFTTQLTTLACLALAVARDNTTISSTQESAMADALRTVPQLAASILNHDQSIRTIAEDIASARDILYLGRGGLYPLALEGALKLKELSYIHAEGYAAGEMKHGPIALLDDSVPVVAIAPSHDDPLFEKNVSNIQETVARGGRVFLLSDPRGAKALKNNVTWSIEMGEVHPFVAPILYALPVQLLAYHVAVVKGTDVDQPRNLAKSVTVE